MAKAYVRNSLERTVLENDNTKRRVVAEALQSIARELPVRLEAREAMALSAACLRNSENFKRVGSHRISKEHFFERINSANVLLELERGVVWNQGNSQLIRTARGMLMDFSSMDFSNMTLIPPQYTVGDRTDAEIAFVKSQIQDINKNPQQLIIHFADFTSSSFDGSDITGISFHNSNFSGASVTNATIAKAGLHRCKGYTVNFNNSTIRESEIGGFELGFAEIDNFKLVKCVITGMQLGDYPKSVYNAEGRSIVKVFSDMTTTSVFEIGFRNTGLENIEFKGMIFGTNTQKEMIEDIRTRASEVRTDDLEHIITQKCRGYPIYMAARTARRITQKP